MTFADEEFIPVGEQQEKPDYPTAFGITFTPQVSGVVIGVLGLLGAAYLLVNLVQPEWQRYQQLKTEIATQKTTLQNPEAIRAQIRQAQANLDQAKQQNKQVLSLFANEKTLDTLLLDLNSFVKDRRGTLVSFKPGEQAESVVNDGSLGSAVNGKLKRETIDLELEGSFDQVQSILRSFERLQSLLLVKDFKAQVSEAQTLRLEKGKVVPDGQPTIKTMFTLEALSPVSTQQETAAPAAPAAPAQPAKK
jgi:type IV pilus assembly protein PilO